jgi:DNA polymerase elongation subunit (family B)
MKATTKIVKKLNIVKKPVEVSKELPQTPVVKEQVIKTPVTKETTPVVKTLPSYRLFHFDVLNLTRMELDGTGADDCSVGTSGSDDSTKIKKPKGDDKLFIIQMYGINEKGETASILVDDFEPFFYVKVSDEWTASEMNAFVREIKQLIGNYYKDSLVKWDLVDSQKLYGFTAGKQSKFVKLTFKNTVAFNKAKNLWFTKNAQSPHSGRSLCYYKTKQGKKIYTKECLPALIGTELYEANLSPLLRYFHINSVWPNGWVSVAGPRTNTGTTTCKHEYVVSQKQIVAMPEKETVVPYKIMSFDIEAGSSHGDFPLPKKTYKRLAMNMMDAFVSEEVDMSTPQVAFKAMIMTAFGFQKEAYPGIDLVYPKEVQNKNMIANLADYVLKTPIGELTSKQSEDTKKLLTLDAMFDKMKSANKFSTAPDDAIEVEDEEEAEEETEDVEEEEEEEEEDPVVVPTEPVKKPAKRPTVKITIMDVIQSDKHERDDKIRQLDELLTTVLPALEGDPVTMIGSTFVRYGEAEPYLNHCITLGGCTPIPGAVVEAIPIVNGNKVDAEKEVLMHWCDLVQREDPDIIIGYNIFGFDYEFMFRRAEETYCVNEFLQMSRKRGEFCGKRDKFDSSAIEIEHTKIAIASGEYDLRYINMGGRLQVDMYNYFRRNFNLSSYKLDDVASQNISDDVSKVVNSANVADSGVSSMFTELHTKNITGLHVGDFIHIELSSFTSDYYMGGKKFTVTDIRESSAGGKILVIAGHHEQNIDKSKKIRWTMAKDDVSPQDIFRMSNGTDAERAIVAKYCIQDCNLVHHLMRKIDVLTEYMEMSNLCSVPVSFLVFRGQGIKLTSFVAKKCMEKGYLMPDLEKSGSDGGYEGAIVLPPKTKIYIDEPVACVDYSSLYPSSMISQNYCHSSKVWAKEYDLNGRLVKEEGEKDKAGNYVYYGLPNYQYVEIEFDTFEWRRNPARPAAKAQKTKVGKRVVCWAQLPNEEKSVMPSILMELLKAREETKKKAKKASATDPFMANILDKRQLAYKVTANSLYGQCGARTSTFYEKDVAASTTASGRMSIIYARQIVEEIYANRACKTAKHGTVMTNAEYVYGDTDSVFFIFNLTNKETGEKIVGKDALEITIELAQEAAHYSTMFLKPPMNLAYEKTLMPFALLSKKRYVGILYEEDPNKGKLKYMGLSLKRRDSCDYLKDTYGQIINLVMKSGNVMEAIKYLDTSLTTLIAGAVPTDKLEITKALRGYYKNPQQIAHWVLANRIGQRDPGNKPKPGDRMRFIHVTNPNKRALQGEKIETPEYIAQARLKIDYDFYITNQLLKPICQFMGLALEQIWKNQGKHSAVRKHTDELKQMERECGDFELYIKKKEKYCSEKVKALLFDKYLMQIKNDKAGNQPITNFFGMKK